MEGLTNQLLAAIDSRDLEGASRVINDDIDLNVPCAELQGAPPLFLAILSGNLAMVQLLLDHGADPNFRAQEPAASIYTEQPLALAKQSRMLMNWDQYHPIVMLLEKFGAIDEGASVESQSSLEKTKAEAKKWQSQK
jgi:ankyrin repeat protein